MYGRLAYTEAEKAQIRQDMANMHPEGPPVFAGFVTCGLQEAAEHWTVYDPLPMLARINQREAEYHLEELAAAFWRVRGELVHRPAQQAQEQAFRRVILAPKSVLAIERVMGHAPWQG